MTGEIRRVGLVSSAARSITVHWVSGGLHGLLWRESDYDAVLKRNASERRRLEHLLQKAQRDLQSARDKNKPLEQRLRLSEETVAQMEAVKDRGKLRNLRRTYSADVLLSLAERT